MIRAWLLGDKEVIAKLDAFGPNVENSLQRTVSSLAIELQRYVMQNKLSGQVLNVRTGRLRRTIFQRVNNQNYAVTGEVGTGVKYGIYWENGFTRKIGAGARGGPKGLSGNALERYISKHPPGTRDYGPRSFLRTSLDDKRQRILDRLTLAVRNAGK